MVTHTQRERDTHRHIPTIPCPTWSHTHRHTDTHTHRHIAAKRRVLQVNVKVSFLQVNVRVPFNLTPRCLQSFPERPLVGRPPHQSHFDYSRCMPWTLGQRTAGGGWEGVTHTNKHTCNDHCMYKATALYKWPPSSLPPNSTNIGSSATMHIVRKVWLYTIHTYSYMYVHMYNQ